VNASSPLADAPGSRSRISQPASAPRPTLVDVIALMPVDPHEPVGKRIFRALRQAIFVGAMAPGTPLSEKDVSELFHVSRQPVREAFIKLVELGVLQVLPQRGTFVKKISPRQVREGRFIRETIETAVSRKAALAITDDQLQDLAQNLREQKVAAKANDTAGLSRTGRAVSLPDRQVDRLCGRVGHDPGHQGADGSRTLSQLARRVTA
jgi:GntR family transcriptional regulator, rspAB operon transcriptional repressor